MSSTEKKITTMITKFTHRHHTFTPPNKPSSHTHTTHSHTHLLLLEGQLEAQVAEDGVGGVAAGRAHDATARVRACAAEVELLHRRAVGAVAKGRAGVAELVQAEGAVEDVAAVQAKDALQVQRAEHVAANDRVREARRKLVDNAADAVGEGVLEGLVGPVADLRVDVVGRILHKELHHMLAGRRDGAVQRGRDCHLNHRPRGRHAHRGLALRVLNLLHARLKVRCAAVLRPGLAVGAVGHAQEVGQLVHGQVDLEGAARVVGEAHVVLEVARQRAGLFLVARVPAQPRHQLQERVVRRRPAHHHLGVEHRPIRHLHARGLGLLLPLLVHDFLDGGIDLQLCARLARRGRNGRGDCAHAALHIGPHALAARSLAHDVVQQHIGRAGVRRAAHGADDGVGRQRRLENLALKPPVQHVRGRRSEELVEGHKRLPVLEGGPEELVDLLEGAQALRERADKEVWRGTIEERLDDGAGLVEELLVARVSLCVLLGELGDGAEVVGLVCAEDQALAAVRSVDVRWREGGRAARQVLEAVADELEVLDDLRPQQAGQVRGARELEAGHHLLGHRRAAEHVPPLQHKDVQAGLGHVCRRDERVVAAANDDDVAVFLRRRRKAAGRRQVLLGHALLHLLGGDVRDVVRARVALREPVDLGLWGAVWRHWQDVLAVAAGLCVAGGCA
eukprot:m.56912 g.56912  ORF g.56912 m.56912 type:complete len:677 (+) comp13422_c0_seq2:93-2123(+)